MTDEDALARQSCIHDLATTAYRSLFPIRGSDKSLRAVLEETVGNSGSLTRLKLGLLAGRALLLPQRATVEMAAAFEYFHTASLLLDDLPCMDNAQHRRGQACAHHKHGEATAILGALAFINRAYALLWRAFSFADTANRDKAAAYAERCLGESGILDGQALDLNFRTSDGSPRAVARAALGKTVSLLRLTLVTPALLAGAGHTEILALDRLSVYWGLAYQVADDCADLSSASIGKTRGRDALLGHPNFALAAGSVQTIRRLGRLLVQLEHTLAALARMRPAWQALDPLVTRLVRSSSIAEDSVERSTRQCA